MGLLGWWYLAILFNLENDKLSSKALRQSLAYAIKDKSPDEDSRALTPINPSSWAYNPKVKPYNYSQEQAEELFGLEESNLSQPKNSSSIEHAVSKKDVKDKLQKENEAKTVPKMKTKENNQITVKAFLKIASHAKKYANKKIPRDRWVEVIGLLAGRLINDESLIIEDAYPMGHGNAVYAEIKDYKNFARAFQDLKAKGLFICGWYHSHPSYGLFLSGEDMGTQARYQKLWSKSLALVIDPYQIDGTDYGFKIFRANLQTQKWYEIPYTFKGDLKVDVLPDLLEFINPVVDGKALFLEYDTMNG